ncbi:BT1926 family outer membrane beta-barrel protein [uncultured Acetobacteroides sp.]|uniref:BT1926 family outer membrane beta-barrel protein n=1 Tax=uncultured Acetobacteroides sp. TaxID=1760811 RepID=UPI0029F56AC0|nr:BT1926 family outer membrane beta-barrel protein [uncultured Acetobacteroides sp.]
MTLQKATGMVVLCLLTTSLFAQATLSTTEGFAPKKGDCQFSLVFGKGQFINENTSYLLSAYNTTSVGLPSSSSQSGSPATYLRLGSINDNSMVNMVGMQGHYFLTNKVEVNMLASMNITHTPKVNYGEGDLSVPDMPIPAYKWVDGVYSNNYLLQLGTNYWFTTHNPRLFPYLGIAGSGALATIATDRPYTGEVDKDGDPIEATTASSRSGYAWAASGALVMGFDYSLTQGLTLGLEVQPFAYTYSAVIIKPTGYDKFTATNHEFRVFQMPMLKLGVRF